MEVAAPPAAAAAPASQEPAASAAEKAVPRATLDTVQPLASFIPMGYRVLYTVAGNLNRDAWPDRVVVLDTTAVINDSTESGEAHQISNVPRPLLLLLGRPAKNAYSLAARNNDIIKCADCAGAMGGDPFQQVVIKNGYFSVEHYGGSAWRWITSSTFKYTSADHHWYLHRDSNSSFHAMVPDSIETTIRTERDFGRIQFEQFTGRE